MSCESKKFLISRGHNSGFGSVIHVEGFGLALAVLLNRIYVFGTEKIFDDETLCPDKRSLQCYYESLTNCTVNLDISSYKNIHFSEDTVKYYFETGMLPDSFFKQYKNDKYLVIQSFHEVFQLREDILSKYAKNNDTDFYDIVKVYPNEMVPIIDALPIKMEFKYYYWRTISTAYIMRINSFTSSLISTYKVVNPTVKSLNGNCVSMYVRNGDKFKEMKLHSFSEYGRVAGNLMSRYYSPRLIVIALHRISLEFSKLEG